MYDISASLLTGRAKTPNYNSRTDLVVYVCLISVIPTNVIHFHVMRFKTITAKIRRMKSWNLPRSIECERSFSE